MRLVRRRVAALLIAGAMAAGVAGCASGATGASSSDQASAAGSASFTGTASPTLSGTVTVFAAASLKATFTDLASQFEAAHPGTKVALSFAGSSDLVTQITQGAPADVFASADTKNMAKLSDAKLLDGTAKNLSLIHI